MRGDESLFPAQTRTAAVVRLLLAALLAGCGGATPGEDVVDELETPDTGPVETDTAGDIPDEILYGEIEIRVLPPASYCGCSGPPTFQTEETLCGWFLKDLFQFRVQALHTALGYEGVEGIERVKLFQHWPGDPDGGVKIRTLPKPDLDGLFTFEVDRAQNLARSDPPDGTY